MIKYIISAIDEITKRLRALEAQEVFVNPFFAEGLAVPMQGKIYFEYDNDLTQPATTRDTYLTFDGTDIHVVVNGVDLGTIP